MLSWVVHDPADFHGPLGIQWDNEKIHPRPNKSGTNNIDFKGNGEWHKTHHFCGVDAINGFQYLAGICSDNVILRHEEMNICCCVKGKIMK